MARCFEDEDFGYPEAVLQGTNYALFSNGTIGISLGEEERGYNLLYSSANQVEIQLEEPDLISHKIEMLKKPQIIWLYTAALFLLYLLLESKSWSISDQILSQFGKSVLPLCLAGLWVLIGFTPELIYDLQTRTVRDSKYILIKEHLRPQNPTLLFEGRREWREMVVIFTYVQRMGIAGALLLFTPSTEENVLFISMLVTNIAVFSFIFIAFFVFVFPTTLFDIIVRKEKRKIPALPLSKFFEQAQATIESWIEENTGNEGVKRSLQELLEHNEDVGLEFKASMWTKYKTVNKIATEEIVYMEKKAYFLQDEILHTVAAFLNTAGGTLLIGVKDKPISWGDRPAEVFGVKADYKWLGKNNRDADGYIQAVYQVLNNGFGETSTTPKYVDVSVEQFNGKEICRIDVKPLLRVRHGEIYINEKLDPNSNESFYVRIGPSSQKQSISSAARYIGDNFPGYTPSNN